jgi:hypothetical protein
MTDINLNLLGTMNKVSNVKIGQEGWVANSIQELREVVGLENKLKTIKRTPVEELFPFSVEGEYKSYSFFYPYIHDFSKYIKYGEKEMMELVGKIVVSIPDYCPHLITDFEKEAPYNIPKVCIGGKWYDSTKLLHNFLLNKKPCGILRNLLVN